MSHRLIARLLTSGVPLAFPILLILSGCGLTGRSKVAEKSDPDAIANAIAMQEAGDQNAAREVSQAVASAETTRHPDPAQMEPATAGNDFAEPTLAPPEPTIVPVSTNTNIVDQQAVSRRGITMQPVAPVRNPDGTGYEPQPESPPTAVQTARVSSGRVEKVDAIGFRELVLESEIPVIVDFYTDWCGPCKQLAPVLEKVAREQPRLQVVKVNAEKEKKLAQKYRVRAYPTVILFNNGAPVAQYVGLPNIRKALRR